MDRRNFLKGITAIGAVSIIGNIEGSPIVKLASAASRKAKGKFDENLVVFISDLHCNPNGYQPEKLKSVVSDILAMKPMPRNVIALGDLAFLTGQVSEYSHLKPILQPLTDAGITVTLGMGNHDRRKEFAQVFPEFAAKKKMDDRMTFIVETPRADFIILDSLQEGEDKSKWITPGAIDDNQRAWLVKTLSEYKKPVFVCAHHPIIETLLTKELLACPSCCGYIYGHNHRWAKSWFKLNYNSRRLIRTACLPSTGHWGDIGFAQMNLEETKAVLKLREKEFFFPKPCAPGETVPQEWKDLASDVAGEVCTFNY